jgi:hypothetical protein
MVGDVISSKKEGTVQSFPLKFSLKVRIRTNPAAFHHCFLMPFTGVASITTASSLP